MKRKYNDADVRILKKVNKSEFDDLSMTNCFSLEDSFSPWVMVAPANFEIGCK